MDANHQNQRIERIITASVGIARPSQHLEHNAQRQEAPTRSTTYFATTIEGKKFSPNLYQYLFHYRP